MKNITKYIILLVTIATVSCSREWRAEINTDPSTVNKPDLTYLFADAQKNLMYGSYTEWFYDYSQYILPWTQMTVGSRGGVNSSTFNQMGAFGGSYGVFYNQLGGPVARIQNIIDNSLSEYDKAANQYLKAMSYIIHVYYGIRVTDLTGSMPYKEALQGPYTNPPMLTPKFDDQQSLFSEWDNILKECINTLTSDVKLADGTVVPQNIPSAQQDLIYGGVTERWVKLANTLRLKMAVRLYNDDSQAAIDIANSVYANGNLMSTINDDMYWYGGTTFYNFGDQIWHGVASLPLVNMLRGNKDPRLRFVFTKNDFNSMVVQGFLDQNVTIPSYILKDADIQTVNGKKKFMGWKGDGEPWVRYNGAPVTINGEISTGEYNEYFQETKFQLTIGNSQRTFWPTSFYSKNMIQPDQTFTFPDVTEVSKQYIPNGLYAYRQTLVSAAETQFYLAEMKLLGATGISDDPAALFAKGVRLSVESMDRTAKDLNLPYYNEPYDKTFGKAIKLQAGEIEALLERQNYKLTGDKNSDLEKIYLNLIVDHLANPIDIYVTARRSGVPKVGSTIMPRMPFSSGAFPIPRRFIITEPLKSNINYNNMVDAYAKQGFSLSTNEPSILEQQRLWYDKKAPNWGEGLK